MDEAKANLLAKALHGSPWQSGGGIWLVLFHTASGRVVVLGDEVVKEFKDDEAFENDSESTVILLR
jgi:hypothetical protein